MHNTGPRAFFAAQPPTIRTFACRGCIFHVLRYDEAASSYCTFSSTGTSLYRMFDASPVRHHS